jgi:nucleoside-diphosphate-sugar epimerase
MKVLVTGASGFLGGWVAQRLTERGHTVRALVRKSSNRKHLETLERLEFAEGSVEDRASVEKAVDGVDAVVHSAALVKARNEAEYRRTNVEGTKNLVEASRPRGKQLARFVHVSSLEAGGPSEAGDPVPLHQETPVTAYGRSKLAAEKVALEAKHELPVTILRPGAIYGPRDQEILEAFKSVKRGLKPTVAGGKALGSFIFAPDCAEVVARALEVDTPSGSIFHVVDDTPVTQTEFLGYIEDALQKKALIGVSLPRFVLKTVSHGVKAFGAVTNRAVMLTPEKAEMLLMHWVGSSEHAQKAFGWKPTVALPEGVKETLKWYREHGWL